jgi:hypothetical protein
MGVFNGETKIKAWKRRTKSIGKCIQHGLSFCALFLNQLCRVSLKFRLVFQEGLQWPHQN